MAEPIEFAFRSEREALDYKSWKKSNRVRWSFTGVLIFLMLALGSMVLGLSVINIVAQLSGSSAAGVIAGLGYAFFVNMCFHQWTANGYKKYTDSIVDTEVQVGREGITFAKGRVQIIYGWEDVLDLRKDTKLIAIHFNDGEDLNLHKFGFESEQEFQDCFNFIELQKSKVIVGNA